MTNRELLEAAARAAGITDDLIWIPGSDEPWLKCSAELARPWRPLADDGDAFRLIAQFGLEVQADGSRARARPWTSNIWRIEAHSGKDDAPAALRRAIVRAVAASNTSGS